MSDFPEETGKRTGNPQKFQFDTREFEHPFEHGRVLFLLSKLYPSNVGKKIRQLQEESGTKELTFEAVNACLDLPFVLAAWAPRVPLHADPTLLLPRLLAAPGQSTLAKQMFRTFESSLAAGESCALVAQRKGIPSGLVMRTGRPADSTGLTWHDKEAECHYTIERFADFIHGSLC